MHKTILLLSLVLSINSVYAQSKWTTTAEEATIDALLAKMTLAEKVGQMTLFTSDWDQTGPTLRAGYEADIKLGGTSCYIHIIYLLGCSGWTLP